MARREHAALSFGPSCTKEQKCRHLISKRGACGKNARRSCAVFRGISSTRYSHCDACRQFMRGRNLLAIKRQRRRKAHKCLIAPYAPLSGHNLTPATAIDGRRSICFSNRARSLSSAPRTIRPESAGAPCSTSDRAAFRARSLRSIPDRKSVVEGKRRSVRVDSGGRRFLKKTITRKI